MSREVDLIKDVGDGQELWKLAVRVEDLWKSGIGKNEHIEFLILDKQGDNIQVLLPADLCPTWGPKLSEGSTYIMKNFKVQNNEFGVKFCDHPFMLVMVGGERGSKVEPTKLPDIPKYSLKFKPFPDITSGKFTFYQRFFFHTFTNAIGAVYEVAAEKKSFGSKKFPTIVSLADAEMNIVTATLWDKFQTEFLTKYRELQGAKPVIVIIKHGKIKEPQGVYDLTISNAWNGTKLIMDQDLPEIKEFLTRLPHDFIAQSISSLNNVDGNAMVTQNSMGSQYSSGSRYTFKAPATHISELLSLPDEEIVTTVATTHHVCVSKNGWFYLSCAECPKALITDTPPFQCKTKEHATLNPLIKYRIEVEVRYERHKAKFLFWDRECAELIGKTASEVKEIMIKAGAFGLHEYPKILDDMMGKELALKVKVQSKAKMCNVLTCKSDPEIINHIKDMIKPIENESPLSLLPPNFADGTSSFPTFPTQDLTDSQESECDSIKNQTPSKMQVEDYSTHEPQSDFIKSQTPSKMQVEDYSTHEPQSDFIKTQTPSKRTVGDSGANEPESGKLSSTRIRLRSVIKKEKSGLPPAI
ncbi:hypothetical protein P8452_62041 [Trifolium repens]|nr:hypothetical protein P8452_62041 [Trifolium repens]